MASRQPIRPGKPTNAQRSQPASRKPAVNSRTARGTPSQTPRPPAPAAPTPVPAPEPVHVPPPLPSAPAPAPEFAALYPTVAASSGDGLQLSQTTMDTLAKLPKPDTKEKPYLDYLNDYVVDWKEPGNLEPIKSPRFHNAGRLSPKLRPIGTPPGLVSYKNRNDFNQAVSALPPISSSRYAPIDFDALGLNTAEYRYADNLEPYGRRPADLRHIQYSAAHYKQQQQQQQQQQPQTVGSRINLPSLLQSQVPSAVTLPSNQLVLINLPNARFGNYDRLDTFAGPRIVPEPTLLNFVPHEAATHRYVEEFIGHCIEDQFVPDILHETINELNHERQTNIEVPKYSTDTNEFDINRYIDTARENNTHLYSDDWVRQLGLQQQLHIPSPVSNLHAIMSPKERIDYKEGPPIRADIPLRFRDMVPETQTRVLTDVNQDFIDFELHDLLRDLGRDFVAERTRNATIENESRRNIYPTIEPPVIQQRQVIYEPPVVQQQQIIYDPELYNPPKRTIDQGQYNSTKKYAENNLMDTICLDNLIVRYINQTDSPLDYDEGYSRLLDGTMLDNLINQYHSRDEYR
ncbi:unnamed protein product [Adineta steineri]|uniref:Uncharacterized protein n=1 Tax=Adineta steineri TaxID=433720 RepID=A0A815KSC6_9BILA|nr:unnamed protein product [Adineta steineri]